MDRFIARMQGERDGDLVLCHEFGVAYQADMTPTAAYDDSYFDKCAGYEGSEIAEKINAGRVAFVNKHMGGNRVLDVGIGSGEFIRRRPNTWGTDVNPRALKWLRDNGHQADDFDGFAGYTFWDVIEHVPAPEEYLRHVQLGAYVFTSIPIVYGLRAVRQSKHYRPGEHLYYWTEQGFTNWMRMHGFMLLETSRFEIDAGRESIMSFTFKRFAWPR